MTLFVLLSTHSSNKKKKICKSPAVENLSLIHAPHLLDWLSNDTQEASGAALGKYGELVSLQGSLT